MGCLRTVHATYPDDPGLARPLTELRTGSSRFDELWRAARAGQLRGRTVTLAHPDLGTLELDCDVLLVPEADQTAVVYSTRPWHAARLGTGPASHHRNRMIRCALMPR
ncbi:hypothetical protein IU432_22165 [Nocardia cyriacigeorgica]|nr:hypothetical protein [Nocardia cyriacigeorgica]MBF6479175.1 hypothetical protein [Nocardia cyriacigeorgica]MBF6553129.1 hypothetical protein [Nocardia cyriacigeorgica]